MADEPYQVFRWTTAQGRACAAMLPPRRVLTDEMKQQISALADENPPAEGENPEFHFTLRFTDS